MQPRKTVNILLSIFLISSSLLTSRVPIANATGTIYIRADGSIDPPTPLIQQNGNIYTFTGDIFESIVLEKSGITIDGNGFKVQGVGAGAGLDLTSTINVIVQNVNVAQFRLGIYASSAFNITLTNNTVIGLSHPSTNDWNANGITLIGPGNNTIKENNLSLNQRGIFIYGPGHGNKISNNTLSLNQYGILLGSQCDDNIISDNFFTENVDGLHLDRSKNNLIKDNIMINNINSGVYLDPVGDGYNIIRHNTLTNNSYGIRSDLPYRGNNTITNNRITLSRQVGIKLDNSKNNKIYHNNFVNNTQHATVSQFVTNFWDNGYPVGGNFWTNYAGEDLIKGPYQNETGSDGIGDTSYTINEQNLDRYPLMHSWSFLSIHNMNTGLGYATIQQAINANETLNNHTIFVEEGIYYECLIVNKSISLIGKDRTNTILDGNKTGKVIQITASHVTVCGFTIRNCATRDSGIDVFLSNGNNINNNIFENNYFGMFFYYSNNNIIMDNTASNGTYDGIRLFFSNNNSLINNYFSSNLKRGIYLVESKNNTLANNIIIYCGHGGYGGIIFENSHSNALLNNTVSKNTDGIYLVASRNNVFVGNNASFNSNYGLCLDSSGESLLANNTFSSNLYNFHVRGNFFSNFNNSIDTSNTVGGNPICYLINETNTMYDAQTIVGVVYLINCNNVTIKDQTVTHNGYGILLWNTTNCQIMNVTISNNMKGIRIQNSHNNTIFHNNFIDNIKQAETVSSSFNLWDNNFEGNYWSDYTGVDLNHDGIGDNPHIIDADNQDNYPLMSLFIEGDCNHDGIVDIKDATFIGFAWNTTKGMPGYIPHADLNMDNAINMEDAEIIRKNWQRHI